MKYLIPFLAATAFLFGCDPEYTVSPPPKDAPPPEVVVSTQRQAFGVAFQSGARVYPPGGTCDLGQVYHFDYTMDKPLRDLGYTETMAKDSFPTFAAFWQAHTWPISELLDLYPLECAWNDWVWHTDTYLGIGIYIRPNFVTQSRGWIIAPDGWFRVRYGCMTGLGRYSGKHAQVYSDRSGNNPGCTPGTCIEIDHAGWSKRAPDRVCLNSTAWGKDYGVIGGLAYTEGIIIENLRFVGNSTQCPAGVFSTGVTLNEPGENSVIRYCMSTNFKSAGYTIFNGTPFLVEVCSAFNNDGPGFDHLGSNGLCNVTWIKPSGDDNAGGLIRFRPKDSQSVGGGTHQVIGEKSESRTVVQIPIVVEGTMGDLNLTVNGLTANREGTVPIPYLIGGNWTGNQFEVACTGIDLRSNTQALFRHAGKGWTLVGGKPYSGNSFTVNDEGLAFRSRSNMVLNGGPTTPVDPGPITPPPAGMVAKASVNNVAAELAKITDSSASTFWLSGTSMAPGQWVQVDYGAVASRSGLSFDIAPGYLNSYPPKFDVSVSSDGNTWTTTRTDVAGGYPTCAATFTATSCRYIRMTCKATNSNWLGIAAWR